VNYWLCITNDENWEVIKRLKIWGIPDRKTNLTKKVKLGDILVFYLKPKRLAGIFKVVSKSFESNKKIFTPAGVNQNEKFKHRFRVDPITVLNEPMSFIELIEKLKFIKNRRYWGGHLMGKAMRLIPEEDYQTIRKAIIRNKTLQEED